MRLGWVLLVVLSGCAEESVEVSPVRARTKLAPVQLKPPVGFTRLRFGVIPYMERETLEKLYVPLQTYLAASLGVPVDLIIGDTYGSVVEKLERDEVDLVELSPLSYAEASRGASVVCLAQAIADGSATSTAYLVVRDDGPIHELQDLKGKTLGLVDPMSTSGSLFPKRLLTRHGFDLERDFAKVLYLGNHEAVLQAVLDGGVDVGATYQGGLSALKSARNVSPLSFRVIAKTPRVPRDVFCARSSLQPEVIDALRVTLSTLSSRDATGRAVLGPLNLNGFVAFDERDYDEVRAAMPAQ